MNTIILLLATYGLTFIVKQSELFDKPRIWLISKSVWFYKLLSCWFCTSFWCALVVYDLNALQLEFFIFALAAAGFSMAMNLVVSKLASS